jgi:TRAP-type C4-dicarboxylate transport system permease small subunit
MRAVRRLDQLVYRVEQWIVVTALLVMSLVVFLDVVHRRYTDPESKVAAKLAGLVGIEPPSISWQVLQDLSTWAIPLGCVGLGYLAVRTAASRPLWPGRPPRPPASRARAVGISVAIVAGAWAAMRLLFGSGDVHAIETCAAGFAFDCGLFPNGFVWSQPFALVLTLWVGFLGASMATRQNRHLKVEALQRVLPERLRRVAGLLSGLATAGFCLLLAWLAVRYVGYQRDDWLASDRLGALYDGIDLAKWQGSLVLPLAYGIMALRFIGSGVLAFRGELREAAGELGDIDLERAAEEVVGPADEASPDPQAEVETRPMSIEDLGDLDEEGRKR